MADQRESDVVSVYNIGMAFVALKMKKEEERHCGGDMGEAPAMDATLQRTCRHSWPLASRASTCATSCDIGYGDEL